MKTYERYTFDEWYKWWMAQASNTGTLNQYELMKIAYEAGYYASQQTQTTK